jgi:DNA modification methylase
MKQLPDKCVDLVLTDPPYGIGADKGVGGFGSSKTDNHYKDNWDNKTPDKEVFDEILRVGKSVIIFGGQFFADKLPTNGHWIVWDKKGNIVFENPFGDCELAWTNLDKKSVKKYVCIQQGFVSEERDRFHPTQKPVKLFGNIIKDYCPEGGVVLDCFMGSGTTALACKNLNRNFIGIEISEKYCEIAKQRLRQDILL